MITNFKKKVAGENVATLKYGFETPKVEPFDPHEIYGKLVSSFLAALCRQPKFFYFFIFERPLFLRTSVEKHSFYREKKLNQTKTYYRLHTSEFHIDEIFFFLENF